MPSAAPIFFRPPGGWLGDVIPYFWDGQYWLFYLHETRSGVYDAGTSWHLACTRDFVDFEYRGEVLPHGGPEEQDLHAYTGCVLEHQGVHHLFYTGYNPAVRDPATGVPLQAVMHAVSSDLLSWTKLPRDTFHAPADRHDPADWRDPFVFRAPGESEFTMLLAARTTTGPRRRRGCVARAVSRDLSTWTVTEPFSAPSRFVTHECPDVFELGGRWYLMYSEFSERFATRYRVAKTPHGPWRAPADDGIDARGFYAAKTAGDGERRFAFGWIPTRQGTRDAGDWEWAGDLAVHEITAQGDGTLAADLPESVRAAWSRALKTPGPRPVTGDWSVAAEAAVGAAPDGLATLWVSDLPARCRVTATVSFTPGTRECGMVLRGSDDLDAGYFLRLEPPRGRMVFDRWPRAEQGAHQWQISGDVPHALELERPAVLDAGVEHRLEVLIDDTAYTAYLDGRTAMSGRMYDRRAGGLGVFVGDGEARFTNTVVHVRTEGDDG
ncbi:glycoside hydrolase family 32 protein [Streptomyces malaysiensis]|uniref:beta-fructofuranosidase n=1 Tax=Streptomyces malaysiensis TaxID=92644 RepID=A0A7X5WWH1_STRMQ|nr:glycoside hydrolase family 32 protein [Streptomyces malaysiensis]NIY62293.1 glycoside hydrolase family protein [Streptomyces malaysiensis]